MEAGDLDSWNTQDFIDHPASSPTEDDPWDPLALLERASSSPDTTPLEVQFTPYESQPTGTSHDELYIPGDWPEDDFAPYSEEELLDEPILTGEFDPDLRSELYEAFDSIDIAHVDIRLDLFLARVSLSEEQDRQVRDYLKTFSKIKRSNWLTWLTSKVWTGQTLILFVQFLAYWEDNPEWWESNWYDPRHGWLPSTSPRPNALSRDNAYCIVHDRIDFPPDKMIDSSWFGELDYYSLWQYDYPTFASFAKFRAELEDGEKWEDLVDWRSDEEERIESEYWTGHTRIPINRSVQDIVADRLADLPTYSHTVNVQHWYDIQDWYPKDEWHDNLGWSMPSVGTGMHTYLSNPLRGPIWPIGGRNE